MYWTSGAPKPPTPSTAPLSRRQGFVKSILDVADNLERATKAVPEEVLGGSGGEDIDAESAKKMLLSMLEGVQLTEKVLLQVRRPLNPLSFVVGSHAMLPPTP